MAVTLGTYGATGSTSWSTFTAPSTGNIYYVSTSGIDSNNGLSVGAPVQTIAKAYQLAAAAGSGKDHYILLKRGDTFTKQMLGPYDLTGTNGDFDGNFELDGTSATNPFVWGNYDPANPGVVNPSSGGNRPIVKFPAGRSGYNTTRNGGNYTAIVGIRLIGYANDPSDPSFGLSLVRDAGAIGSGGSGYVNNDIVTLVAVGGTTVETARITVSVTAGVVTDFFTENNTGSSRFNYSGLFLPSSLPTSFTATGGSGTGLTLTSPTFGRPGSNSGVALSVPVNWLLIEDCDIRYATVNGWSISTPHTMLNGAIRMRRTSFSFNYGSGLDGGGIDPWFIEECVFWHNGHISGVLVANQSVHNLYGTDMGRKGDPGTASTSVTIRGNILGDGPSSSQFRGGFIVYDNMFLKESLAHNWGNPEGNASQCYNNVYLEGLTSIQSLGAMEGFSNAYGDGYATNNGTLLLDGNIAANSISSTGNGFEVSDGANGWTVTNNIVYNWAPSSTPPTNTILSFSGCVFGLTITNGGTGYPDNGTNPTITGIRRESIASGDEFDSNYVVLQVSSSLNMNCGPHDLGCGSLYLSGVTGTMASQLNDKVWICAIRTSRAAPGEVVLYCPANNLTNTSNNLTGTVTGGTVYIPYRQVTFTGGGGSNTAKGDLFVKGGAVVACYMGGSTGDFASNAGGAVGLNYTGASIGASNTQLGNAGSGFAATPILCSNTIGGSNQLFPSGGGSFLAPGRTSGSYYTSIGSPGGYSANADGFLQAASENTKWNGTTAWNPALTANNGINPYIRAGFGIGSGGGTPPTLMPQICM